MKEAAVRMKRYLEPRFVPATRLVRSRMNVDGQCRQDAGAIQTALAQQLDHSVEWVKSVESLEGARL